MMTKQIPHIPRWQTIINTLRIFNNPIPVFKDYLSRYGDTYHVYVAGVMPAIFSADPAFAQHVLQKNHRNYRKSEIQTDAIGTYVGKGLLTTDGAYWLQQRRLIQPGFHRERLKKIQKIMTTVIDRYMSQLEAKITVNPVVDIHQETLEVAHRIIVQSLFSDNLNEDEMKRLGKNITEVQRFLIKQIRLSFLDGWFALTGQKRKYLNIAKESNNIILKYINDRRQGSQQHDDLLQMLMESRYEDTGEGMTDKQILDESLILFVAGHETSANAMAWMIYLLSQHPEVLAKLKADDSGDYAKMVVNESLRLYPPAWITDRVAIDEDEFKGVRIPKGILVIPYIYGIHHSEKVWDDPEKFIPERFDQNQERHPFAFMPFGGGPRLCIGNNFAMMEMEMFLKAFVERFDFELVTGQKIEMQPLVTLRPKNGIKMMVKNRCLTV